MSANEGEEPEALFRNYYQCDRCGHKWTDDWSCQCDDDCPECGGEGDMQRRFAEFLDVGQYKTVKCPLCSGKGRYDGNDCPECRGCRRAH